MPTSDTTEKREDVSVKKKKKKKGAAIRPDLLASPTPEIKDEGDRAAPMARPAIADLLSRWDSTAHEVDNANETSRETGSPQVGQGRPSFPVGSVKWYASHPDLEFLPGMRFGWKVSGKFAAVGFRMFFGGPYPASAENQIRVGTRIQHYLRTLLSVPTQMTGKAGFQDVILSAVFELQTGTICGSWNETHTYGVHSAVIMILVKARKAYLHQPKQDDNIEGFQRLLDTLDEWIVVFDERKYQGLGRGAASKLAEDLQPLKYSHKMTRKRARNDTTSTPSDRPEKRPRNSAPVSDGLNIQPHPESNPKAGSPDVVHDLGSQLSGIQETFNKKLGRLEAAKESLQQQLELQKQESSQREADLNSIITDLTRERDTLRDAASSTANQRNDIERAERHAKKAWESLRAMKER